MPYTSTELFEFVRTITSSFNLTNLIRVRIKDEGKFQVKYYHPEFNDEDKLLQKLTEQKLHIENFTGQKINLIQLQNTDCCHERCVGCTNYNF